MGTNSNFHPLVSIIIPVYNGANYMREAIDSALAQTYDNIEVIVVNDGSRDDGKTDRIAQSYGDSIRYFSKENGGCASALNFGIEKMQGEYFSWLSHDDRYLPEKIARQIDVLRELANKDTIVFGGYELINEKSVSTGTVRPSSILPVDKLNIPLLPLLRGLVHGCTLLIHRKHFDNVGMFDVNLPSTQDYALWFDIFRIAPLHFDPEILVQSRVHPDQGTHRIEKHIEECNILWSGFLNKLTIDEMEIMSGSSHAFLSEQAKFLANTPYKDAEALAVKMAQEAISNVKVSVIIPFYNRVSWTIEAVRSVLAQTHQAFEILLIDDGSTDDLSPLTEFIKTDKRITYIKQENAGPAKARNRGVEHATGAYIAFLDADDLFYPEKLDIQLKFMLEHGAVFSHTSYQRMDLKGDILGTISSGIFRGNVFPRIIASCPIAMPTVMARTDILKTNRFYENFEIAEDVCLWITIASKYEICGIDMVLSKVRVGPNTAALNSRKQAMGYINIAHFIIHDPYLSQFERQIRSLLIDATAVFVCNHSPDANSVVTMLAPSRLTQRAPLMRKGLSSLRSHGVRVTWQRIRRYMGW